MKRLELSPATRWKLFWLSAAATVLLMAWLSRYDRDLRSSDGSDIVALELAGSGTKAEAILCTWQRTLLTDEGSPSAGAGTTALDRAIASLRWDFVFLLVYPLAIGLGCCWAAGALERQGVVSPERGGRALRGLAWAQAATPVLDAIENVALLAAIGRFRSGHPVGDALPMLARWCAIPKFALILAGLAVMLVALGVRALGGGRTQRTRPGGTSRPAEGDAGG